MESKTLLNFANESDFSTALDYFGGEEYLKNNFPNMLQMVYSTKELHGQTDELTLEYDSENNNEDNNAGYEDSYEIIELLEVQPQSASANSKVSASSKCSSVYTKSAMSLTESRPFLHISSEITDPKSGKVFYAYAVHDKEKNYLDTIQHVSGNLLNYSDNVDIQVKSDFMTVKNVNGKFVCDAGVITRTRDINILNMASDIKNIKVLAPVPKNAGDTFIKVVYQKRSDKNAAYTFNKATKKDNAVTVYYPFSIQIELDDAYEFDNEPIKYDQNFYISLASDVIKKENNGGGGEVHFNEAFKRSKIRVAVQNNILTLTLPYDQNTDATYWGTDMVLSGNQASGYFDFHLNTNIYYHIKGTGYHLNTAIVVTSANLNGIGTSPNMRKIQQSSILWGCLGKNTHIMTKQGEKNISELREGDIIITDSGEAVLKQLITGHSEKIIAVGTCEEDAVWLTAEHPISTKRGLISAGNLTVDDLLKTRSGELKEINYLAGIDYNDTVYSLELETSALIDANGYLVGDYKTSPLGENNILELQSEAEPINDELLEELERWSSWKDEQLKKTINV